jgi:hypothetical protein
MIRSTTAAAMTIIRVVLIPNPFSGDAFAATPRLRAPSRGLALSPASGKYPVAGTGKTAG